MTSPEEFLRKIPPFSFLSPEESSIIVSGLDIATFKKDMFCYQKGKRLKCVYLLFSGLIGLYDSEEIVDYVSRGELFGVLTAAQGSPAVFDAKALEDTVCYLIPNDRFREVFEKNSRFASFFNTFIAKRFRSFSKLARETELYEQSTFILDVEQLVTKEPVTCGIRTTVKHAISMMDENRVGSIIVIDDEKVPLGILTNRDLRKVILHGDKEDLVSRFMSSPVMTMDSETTVLDAYNTMITSNIDYLVIIKQGKVTGTITSKDILLQLEPSTSLLALYRKIIKATNPEDLKTACTKMKMAIAAMALKDLHFYDLSRMITSINDSVVKKVIEFVLDEYAVDGFVWVHMGSSGRKEQVITTDQDNALVVSKQVPAEFARKVNTMLEDVGIPKCPANYMASNEQWNTKLDTWKDYFKKWFNEPIPDHIRYLTIFLDIRPIYGDKKLYRKLLGHIYKSRTNQAVRFLAHDATLAQPPIGIFGIKHLDKGVDLKRYGIYPISNGIRVLALDNEVLEVGSTKDRIEILNDMKVISDEMCTNLIESYAFLQDLRLKHQAKAIMSNDRADNRITVEELDKMDLLVLKEALKIVSSFQSFLKSKYVVERVF